MTGATRTGGTAAALLAVALGSSCASPRAPRPVGNERSSATVRVVVPIGFPSAPGAGLGGLDGLVRSAVDSEGLVLEGASGRLEPGRARGWRSVGSASRGTCLRFDSGRGTAAVAAGALRDRLAAASGGYAAFLVEPGLDVRLEGGDGTAVTVCSRRTIGDLARRLGQPPLWLPVGEGSGRGAAVRWIDPSGQDPAVLLRDGAADVAIVAARPAALAAATAGVAMRRLDAWDRTYALWIDPHARYLVDPRLRQWIAGRVDRAAMVEVALAGRGEPAASLVAREFPPGPRAEAGTRPLARGTRPRLVLGFQDVDPVAFSIASRLRAELAPDGIDLEIRPLGSSPRAPDLTLVPHEPPTLDPILGLAATLSGLGPSADAALAALDASAILSDAASRRRAALEVERDLARDGRLVPLVRAHLFLATRAGVARIVPGPAGRLDLPRPRRGR